MPISRIEKDSIGYIEVADNQLWGSQTQRSLKYFNISDEKMPFELIRAIAQIKRVAAQVNADLGLLDRRYAQAIILVTDEILNGEHMKEFPLSVWQTGSGTQTNMNINEVIANRASELLGGKRGENRIIHPNDHVNKSQSSNDVFPTAMHIASVIAIKEHLIPQILILKETLAKKSVDFNNIIKIGRTHLQDAVPLTLGQEISSWVSMLDHNLINIKFTLSHLYELALGGTAVGTGLNSHPEYAQRTAYNLSLLTGHPFVTAPNKFESLATSDALVNTHGSLKTLASSMMKISNDIRWLSSGPRCGIGELIIPANEPGSSIMPGKINPTQCEAVNMLCCQVFGNDVAINFGGASGNFELNVHRPLIIYNFLQSARLLQDGIKSFNRYCISGMEPNRKRIIQLLEKSLMLVTALTPYIGYDKATKIAQKAYQEDLTLKAAALKLGYLDEQDFDRWIKPENMVNFSCNK
ncbi:class II fumarate hydratase [Blochmannia endosymbiont of Colobopsis nipponica]|uniref:class II fumarate hydratase n=1 Tax=Blochmannia endosymbiont of Colobopsis nipponica TaxID=2681987 RepID=UPI00178370F7|nr:class II fumarate hydratase [Blochmannia endosymbiont of Colobopsis nipponica]QOI11075.1 class II fumarate hydratase [Blochmannia endosymbiont of Colobopsis nipponica]